MKLSGHIIFWAVVHAAFTFYFGRQIANYEQAFYFTSMLLPVVIGSCYFFNLFLVPKYLLTNKYLKFGLYTVYLLVVSLYLEMVVLVLSFILLAEYSYNKMLPGTTDIFMLAIALYFVVLLYSFVELIRKNKHNEQKIDALEEEKEKIEAGNFSVRANRKTVTLDYDEVLYIESLGDYVKIHRREDDEILTKEKISHLEERLPDLFVRIHRSFIINKDHITAFNKEEVEVNDHVLPISRTYKKSAIATLSPSDGSHR